MSDNPDDHRRYPRRGAAAKSASLNTSLLAPARSPTKPQRPVTGGHGEAQTSDAPSAGTCPPAQPAKRARAKKGKTKKIAEEQPVPISANHEDSPTSPAPSAPPLGLQDSPPHTPQINMPNECLSLVPPTSGSRIRPTPHRPLTPPSPSPSGPAIPRRIVPVLPPQEPQVPLVTAPSPPPQQRIAASPSPPPPPQAPPSNVAPSSPRQRQATPPPPSQGPHAPPPVIFPLAPRPQALPATVFPPPPPTQQTDQERHPFSGPPRPFKRQGDQPATNTHPDFPKPNDSPPPPPAPHSHDSFDSDFEAPGNQSGTSVLSGAADGCQKSISDPYANDFPRSKSQNSRWSGPVSECSQSQAQDAGGHPRPDHPGRPRDEVHDATRNTNRELNRVLQAASEEYAIPQEILLKAFLKDRDQRSRVDSSWNIFQRKFAHENKLRGDADPYTREEVAAKYEQFKEDNNDWQEQLDLYLDAHHLEMVENRTYLLQQRELEKLFDIFQLHAERAHLLHFEVMFSIVGSTIYQNDALHRLYYTPGLVNFSTKRLGVDDEELLALIMTEACDTAAGPTTEFIRDTIIRNRTQAGSHDTRSENDCSSNVKGNDKQKKGKNQERKTDKKQEKKLGSSTIMIVTQNIAPPRPDHVVIPTGETIDIPFNKNALPENSTYEQKIDFIKPIIHCILSKGGLRTSTKTLPWARLPPLLAEAGWCLINYPANTQMPGEVPPGVDTQKYIHEGIRAIKRPALAEFAKELVHPQSPSWKLIKGDRKLMEANRMPVIIQAPPVFTPDQERQLQANKKNPKAAGSSKSSSLPLEHGRRLYANMSFDNLGPCYVVRDDSDDMYIDDTEDDDKPADNMRKGKGKGKGRGRGKGVAKRVSRSPPGSPTPLAPEVLLQPNVPGPAPAIQVNAPPQNQLIPPSHSPHFTAASIPPSPILLPVQLPLGASTSEPSGNPALAPSGGALGVSHQPTPQPGQAVHQNQPQAGWIAPGAYQSLPPTQVTQHSGMSTGPPYAMDARSLGPPSHHTAGQQYGYPYHQVHVPHPTASNASYPWPHPSHSPYVYTPNPSSEHYYSRGQHPPPSRQWHPSQPTPHAHPNIPIVAPVRPAGDSSNEKVLENPGAPTANQGT